MSVKRFFSYYIITISPLNRLAVKALKVTFASGLLKSLVNYLAFNPSFDRNLYR